MKKLFNPSGLLIKSLLSIYDGEQELATVDLLHQSIHEVRVLGFNHNLVAFEKEHDIFIPIKDVFGNIAIVYLNGVKKPFETYSYKGNTLTQVTDKSGKIQPLAQTTSSWNYQSLRCDKETGLIVDRSFYYDLTTGQWINPLEIGMIHHQLDKIKTISQPK